MVYAFKNPIIKDLNKIRSSQYSSFHFFFGNAPLNQNLSSKTCLLNFFLSKTEILTVRMYPFLMGNRDLLTTFNQSGANYNEPQYSRIKDSLKDFYTVSTKRLSTQCLSQKHFKACVRYFFIKFYFFSPNDSPLNTMKNVFYFIKKLFVLEIFIGCNLAQLENFREVYKEIRTN